MSLYMETVKGPLLRQFEERMKSIDQIARLAIEQREKKITDKYGNIQSTAKILKALILQFTKKSIKLEEELRSAARIEDLQYQTQYHTTRLQMCLKLSSDLQTLIGNKKQQIKSYETESKKLKQELILVKTQNIKKILKIEMFEQIQKQNEQKQMKDIKMTTIRSKMYENRALMQTGLTFTPSVIDSLKKQKQDLQTMLWQKINKKITISNYLFNNYNFLKDKLMKQEKKSNLYGLHGSLFFKLQANVKLSNTFGPVVSRKNKLDHKLLIYDVLKQKHSNQIKDEKKHSNEIIVQFDQFMTFTPIQILGLIELKGGISFLRKNGAQIFSDIKRKTSQNSLNQTKAKITAKKV